ncbi:MAG: hypothetical protein MJA83_04355, partial [Gammaproteobacteria bacterium]|nr:hypothetical protein [Gammaproteobacteria bacterium]
VNWLLSITDNQSGGDIQFTYDDNGNTLSKLDNTGPSLVSTQFEYDSRDQLVQVIRGPPGTETSQGRYDYDFAGMRVRHLDSERGDIEYFYDDTSILEERNANTGDLVTRYNYADRLLSLQTPTSTQYYHFDALGSTVNLTEESGAVQVSYRLDPWGNIREQQGTSVNRQIFTGQELDENTGLVYFGARYYDPDLGRFITQDPFLGDPNNPPSLHRYLYAQGNPAIGIDEDGFFLNNLIGGLVSVGVGFVISKITGTEYSLTDAAIDFGLGAATSGLSVLNKINKVRKLGPVGKAAVQEGASAVLSVGAEKVRAEIKGEEFGLKEAAQTAAISVGAGVLARGIGAGVRKIFGGNNKSQIANDVAANTGRRAV